MPTPELVTKQLSTLRKGLNAYRNSLSMSDRIAGADVYDALTGILSSADARSISARKPGRPRGTRNTNATTTRS